MRRRASPAPWPDLEQQAYHAYREWPLWLVLRARELQLHLRGTRDRSGATAPTAGPLEEKGKTG